MEENLEEQSSPLQSLVCLGKLHGEESSLWTTFGNEENIIFISDLCVAMCVNLLTSSFSGVDGRKMWDSALIFLNPSWVVSRSLVMNFGHGGLEDL